VTWECSESHLQVLQRSYYRLGENESWGWYLHLRLRAETRPQAPWPDHHCQRQRNHSHLASRPVAVMHIVCYVNISVRNQCPFVLSQQHEANVGPWQSVGEVPCAVLISQPTGCGHHVLECTVNLAIHLVSTIPLPNLNHVDKCLGILITAYRRIESRHLWACPLVGVVLLSTEKIFTARVCRTTNEWTQLKWKPTTRTRARGWGTSIFHHAKVFLA
jgi:hypothetical protein